MAWQAVVCYGMVSGGMTLCHDSERTNDPAKACNKRTEEPKSRSLLFLSCLVPHELPRRTTDNKWQITLALNRPDMAYSAADALASAMYDSMFDWLVGRVNFAVQVRTLSSCGVLRTQNCNIDSCVL